MNLRHLDQLLKDPPALDSEIDRYSKRSFFTLISLIAVSGLVVVVFLIGLTGDSNLGNQVWHSLVLLLSAVFCHYQMYSTVVLLRVARALKQGVDLTEI